MTDIKTTWRRLVARALDDYRVSCNAGDKPITAEEVILETPPKPELGDLGFPMFVFSKTLRKGPPQIAMAIQTALENNAEAAALGKAHAEGPYLNVTLKRDVVAAGAIDANASGSVFGRTATMEGRRIMVEFSSPNTNKPLHLGHLRNNALGESISRILVANGAEVRKVNLVQDRGVHICKSMVAYMTLGNGATPESAGLKSDHFVGHYYVRFGELKTADRSPEDEAQDLLRKWEAGDPTTLELWKRMREWALAGLSATYKRTGISFDTVYYESELYEAGKREVLSGLDRGIFYKEEDGSIWVNLEDIGLDRKVLLRKDGTSIYITQDIGTAMKRHKDWSFDRLVYVVAHEQQYHFKVLFEILKRLGNAWAENLYHLSYGLVNLPEGRMKTREGTVVDADDLLDSLASLARDEIASKGREEAVGDVADIAEKIALGALHYYLLQASPIKDMLFDPKESLSFNGATGPYIQYMGARISSMLRKHAAGEGNAHRGIARPELLIDDAEWALVKRITAFPETIARAGADMDPSVVAVYLYDLASDFSAFYHDHPILTCEDADRAASRLALAAAVGQVLRNGCALVCIPFLEAM